MAERDLEQLVITLSTNVNQLTREFKKANQIVVSGFNDQEKAAKDHARKLAQIQAKAGREAGTAFSSAFRATMGGVIAALSVKELAEVADSYTRIGNSLKLAGVQGASLARVQDELFKAAQKNGVEWESLAKLFGRAAQSQKALGITTGETLDITRSVAAAIKIQGGDVEAARGAMLQLSQALATGTVRAEEYNSINEGMLPVLQAVANNNKAYGGSIANVRKAMLEGKLSSKELAKALIEQRGAMEKLAATADSTLGQSMERLKNAFIRYIGQADDTADATKKITLAIDALANRLDLIIPVVALLAGSLGLGALITAMGNAAVAAGSLRAALLATFGGPWGLIISGIVVALTAVAIAEHNLVKPGKAVLDLNDKLQKSADDYSEAASKAANATDEQRKALQALADEKRKQLIANRDLLVSETKLAIVALAALRLQQMRARTMITNVGSAGAGDLQANSMNLAVQKAENELIERTKKLNDIAKQLEEIDNVRFQKPGAVEETEAERKKREAAEERARKLNLRQEDRAADAIARADAEILAGKIAQARTIEERARLELEQLDAQKRASEKGLDRDVGLKKLSPEDAVAIKAADERARDAERMRINTDRDEALRVKSFDVSQAELDMRIELLNGQLDLARTAKDRKAINAQILALENQSARAKIEEVQRAQGSSQTEDEIALLEEQYRDSMEKIAAEAQRRASLGPWGAFQEAQQTASSTRMEGVEREAVQSIDTFATAVSDAATGTQKFTDSLNNAIRQIEAELIQMAVKQAISGIGTLLGFAGGGDIRGPGTSTSDSIPILASNGEKMMNARANRKYGPVLDAMNRGMVPRLATGGPVGSMSTFSGGPTSKKGGVVFDMRGAMIWEDEVANIMQYVDHGDQRASVLGGRLGAASAASRAQRSAINRLGLR